MGRAPCCQKVGLKKGRWTAEEDEILTNYIAASGEGSWRSLPMNAGLLRCGKSCRLRWINYLKAGLKRGNITHEEEQLIIKLHASLGNRWSLIAGHLPGRTDNEIKNYWNSHLSRRIHSFRRAGNNGETVIMDIGKIPGGRRWRGGRTSRAAMKKNSTILTTTTAAAASPYTTGIMRKEKQANNSTAPFDCLDFDHQAGSLTLEELEDMASELLSPSQVLESGAALWATADLGAISEDSVGWESHGKKEGALREDDVIRSWDWEMCEGGKEMGPWVWSSEEESGEVMNDQLQGIEGCWPEIESVASWLLSDGDGATLS